MFAKVATNIVIVHVTRPDGQFQGSGVILAPTLVVTNRHVVEGATEVTISRLAESFAVTAFRADPVHDLSLLQVPTLQAEPIAIRSSSSLQIGEKVFAVGAPRGLELSLAEGLVSSLREHEGGTAIQTTASVSPGSSGGGLFDDRGQLVGITTFGIAAESLNFALPGEWVVALAGSSTPATGGRGTTNAASDANEPHRVIGTLDPPAPKSEEEKERVRAEAIYRPRMQAVAGMVQQLRVLNRRYFDACYSRATVRVRSGEGRTTSQEVGGGQSHESAVAVNSRGDFVVGSGSTSFGWASVRTQSQQWQEVTTIDNSTTPVCRVMWSDITDLLPRITAVMEEADREAIRQSIWTWLRSDVPEKLAREVW